MNDEIAQNIVKALLLLSKRIDDINLNLKNISQSLEGIASLKQEETN